MHLTSVPFFLVLWLNLLPWEVLGSKQNVAETLGMGWGTGGATSEKTALGQEKLTLLVTAGEQVSMPQPKTRPDSPVPSLQGPCDRSLKSEVPCGSCLNWR